ncbi:MAG TPA: N-acetyl-1-D-myo-inositol-2-amino-2-deoxy-alpha-D-glucopyranoside deacetylase [Jiangellaceae bacterium]|nr:N-acetyl-1-D-myo-inositol-2-amino-2-deoxy-alpha-D-glucopyranoside deacetylase [Jiangellaceae bacterium]
MVLPDADRRLLLVHAHPDDETITNGGTMARYVAEGAHVTLVTCTLGEQGEVLVPELAHLAAEREDGLGQHRIGELAQAMKELGVRDHRFLGGPGRFRDSGMVWDASGRAIAPPDVRADAFWRADLREAADLLVEVIREIRPQVVLTYDEHGNYGHPDHVQAHRVAHYATDLAGVPSYRADLGPAWTVAKMYWTAMPRSVIAAGIAAMKDAGTPFEGVDNPEDLGMVVEDEDVSARIDASEHLGQKEAALRAHATQVAVDSPFFALSNNVGRTIWGQEHYRIARGEPGPVDPDSGYETDLFAGIGSGPPEA